MVVKNPPEIKNATHPRPGTACLSNKDYNVTLNVSYICMTKSGSTTMKTLIRNHNCGLPCKDFVFTFIRHPLHRLISAYATVSTRGNCVSYRNPNIKGIPFPPKNDTIDIWRKHFNDQIDRFLTTMMLRYNDGTGTAWNEHLIK